MAEKVDNAPKISGGSNTGATGTVKDKFNNMSKGKRIGIIILTIVLLVLLIIGCGMVAGYFAHKKSGVKLRGVAAHLSPISAKGVSTTKDSPEEVSDSEGRKEDAVATGNSKKKKKGRKGSKVGGKSTKKVTPSSNAAKAVNLLGINDVRLTTMENSLAEKAEEAPTGAV